MNAYQKKQQKKKRKSFFRKWHRRIGFTVALFVVNLSITGILLNHYEGLGLHQNYIESDWILDAYNIQPPKSLKCYQSGQHNVCQAGEALYLNGEFWHKSEANLIGFYQFGKMHILITNASLYLKTNDLKIIDEINLGESLSQLPQTSFRNGDQLIFPHQNGYSIFDPEMEEWQEVTDELCPSSYDRPLRFEPTDEARANILSDYRLHQVTILTFVQDLHSGRVFGTFVMILNDITAIALIILVISGYIAWQRRKEKKDNQNFST